MSKYGRVKGCFNEEKDLGVCGKCKRCNFIKRLFVNFIEIMAGTP